MSIYQKRYDKLINHYKNVITEGYTERHHIIPKCMGGSNNKENLVDLPAKAHFLAHWLLIKIYPTNRRLLTAFTAFRMDKYGKRKFTAAQYAKAQQYHAELTRQQMIEFHKNNDMSGANNYFYGKKHSEESRRKMSKPCRINGIKYNSVQEGRKALKMPSSTFLRHRASGKIKFEYL